MKIALFKKLPFDTAIYVHPVWKILKKSPGVESVDLFLSQAPAPLPGPATLMQWTQALERRVFKSTVAGRTIRRYGRMRDPSTVSDVRKGEYDIIIPSGLELIPGRFLECARIGVLLFHYGMLPQMRGINTVEWCVLLGRRPGTTLYFYDAGVDTGDIVYQAHFDTGDVRSIADARRRARKISWQLMGKFFSDVEAGLAARRRQEWSEGRTYYRLCAPLLAFVEYKLSGKLKQFQTALSGLQSAVTALPNEAHLGAGEDGSSLLTTLRAPAQDCHAPDVDRAVSLLHFLRLRGRPEHDLPAARSLCRLLDQTSSLTMEDKMRLANEIVPLTGTSFRAVLTVPRMSDCLQATIEYVCEGGKVRH